MKTGIELIADERVEQIEKHERPIAQDVEDNANKELVMAARELLNENPLRLGFPQNWNRANVHKMVNKPYKERLIIAGALIAAEIDRLQFIEQ